MSGIWVRCPNCDLEIKAEMTLGVDETVRSVVVEYDFHDLTQHARDCLHATL